MPQPEPSRDLNNTRPDSSVHHEGSYLLRMDAITKRFPGVMANDKVNFDLMTAEVHALLGENGAGKTTLMNILSGLLQPDSGEIYLRDRKVSIRSPKEAAVFNSGNVDC